MFIWKRQGKLAFLDWGGFQSRNASMIRLVELADRTHGMGDFGPITLNTGDRPCNFDLDWIAVSFAEANGCTDIAIPDFVFDSWQETGTRDYTEVTDEVSSAGDSVAQQQRGGWIGDCDLNVARQQLVELASHNGELLEASHIDWKTDDRNPVAGGSADETLPSNHLTMEQQVRRWAFLLDIEGKGYSGRLKILLHSGRPVFIQVRAWREWFWKDLRPMEHFIPVRNDLADLVEKLEWARANPEWAGAIGRYGQAYAQQKLTRGAALEELAGTFTAIGVERPDDSYVPKHLRAHLDPVMASLGAFA